MHNALKMKQQECCSQFEITSKLLRNLYNYDLTPATKLVLLELTTHMNESKNGSVVFPSVGYIAEVLGIGLTATKKAINDLIKQGFIIKTKRNNVKGNYNKYLFTSKITGLKMTETNIYSQEDKKVRNLTEKPSENELFKKPQNDLFLLRTNNNEQIKQQTFSCTEKPNNSNKGGNVYSGDDEILADYAVKHKAKNVNAYINKLKETGSAAKIIKEYKQKRFIAKRVENTQKETESLKRLYASYENNTCTAESCGCSLSKLKKRGFLK